VGVEAFVKGVEAKAGRMFETAGQTLVQSQNIALGANRVLQRNGKYAHKIIVPSGVFSGTDLIEVAKRAKSFGSGDLRLTYDQNVYVVDIDKDMLDAFESTTIFMKYDKFNNIYFNDMIACAGTHTCSFGVIPNKPDAVDMANFLNNEVAIESGMVRMNWSACPKGCGVHGIADIGFEGCKAKDENGKRVDGVHIFMGGKITRRAFEARMLHKSLPITEAKYHVKYLLKTYADLKERGETFETFEERYFSANYSYQALGFFTKINYILNDKLDLDITFKLEKSPKTFKKENFEIFDFGLKLFKLLTGEKRYVATEGFEPVLVQARKIKRDEVTKLNPNVPAKLSEIIYMMTDNDKKTRTAVFSELLVALKAL
jgi:ferredoxin-nitrite reductase